MMKRNGKVYFSWPEDEVEDGEVESLKTDIECTFLTPITTRRSFRITTAGQPSWTVLISPNSRAEERRSFGGIHSLVIDDEGYIDFYSELEFWWFEGQIYVLLFNDDVTLMKVTSEDPKQDWKWLTNTLVPKYGAEDSR